MRIRIAFAASVAGCGLSLARNAPAVTVAALAFLIVAIPAAVALHRFVYREEST